MMLTLLGYWRRDGHPEWPDPADFVDPDWDDVERHMTSLYVARGTIAKTFRGYSPCRFCGINNGDLEYTDGEYIWPSGLVHYIDEHAVRLPASFVTHAVQRLEEIEAATVDDAWWKSVQPTR
jgi:hypothetical protein